MYFFKKDVLKSDGFGWFGWFLWDGFGWDVLVFVEFLEAEAFRLRYGMFMDVLAWFLDGS